MQITRNTLETAAGPGEWFTGAVYIDTVATPSEPTLVGSWGTLEGIRLIPPAGSRLRSSPRSARLPPR